MLDAHRRCPKQATTAGHAAFRAGRDKGVYCAGTKEVLACPSWATAAGRAALRTDRNKAVNALGQRVWRSGLSNLDGYGIAEP